MSGIVHLRHPRLLLLAALALLVAPLPADAQARAGAGRLVRSSTLAQPAPGGDPRFGLVDAYQYPQARAASGARWERVNFWWDEMQPHDAGEHLPPQTVSDAQLQTELDAGMTVVGLLGNPPAWATRNGSTPANLDLPIDDPNNYWAAFVRSMVATYAGRINQWIIWNEPDIPQGMQGSTWAGSVAEYYQLVKVAAEVAKAYDPGEKIVVAGTTYWVDVTLHQPLWIQRFAAVAAADPTAAANNFYFDAVDLHVYSRASDVLRISQIYRDTLHQFGIDKPLWLSETNVAPYDDPAAPRAPDLMHETMAEQADFIVEALAYAVSAGIERISVYRIADPASDPTGPWGLLRSDGTPRPAFAAYRTAVAQLSGASNVKLTRQPYLDTISYDRGGDKVWLFFASGTGPVQGVAPLLGNAAVVIDKTGAVTPVNLPTEGMQPPIGVPVPGSASHSDDGGPQNTRVGGDPAFLVESGIGGGLGLPDGRQYFPMTGDHVAPPFVAYFQAHGGAGSLGDPTDEAHAAPGGAQTQDFQQAKLLTHPSFADSDYFIESAPAGAPFARGAAFAPFQPAPPPAAGSGARYFPQTGHSVSGAFRRFFDSHGGITIFGYPRTEAFQQAGRQVQWFQRAMFEYHPEFAGTPYEVELRLLGSELTAGRDFARPPAAPTPTATPAPAAANASVAKAAKKKAAARPAAPTAAPTVYFPQTGHSVSFGFLDYFNKNGGLDVFGYPISDEVQEAGPDGTVGTVQYFQRARFEYHPEFAGTPYAVELGLLGDQYLGL